MISDFVFLAFLVSGPVPDENPVTILILATIAVSTDIAQFLVDVLLDLHFRSESFKAFAVKYNPQRRKSKKSHRSYVSCRILPFSLLRMWKCIPPLSITFARGSSGDHIVARCNCEQGVNKELRMLLSSLPCLCSS
eukprot:PhF_6_TR29147/c0_g1_i2/m.42582